MGRLETRGLHHRDTQRAGTFFWKWDSASKSRQHSLISHGGYDPQLKRKRERAIVSVEKAAVRSRR